MGDVGDAYRDLREYRRREGVRRGGLANADYPAAAEMARANGMTLQGFGNGQFNLSHPSGWMVQLYPSNQRIYQQRNQRVRAPFVQVGEEWDLLTIVRLFAGVGGQNS